MVGCVFHHDEISSNIRRMACITGGQTSGFTIEALFHENRAVRKRSGLFINGNRVMRRIDDAKIDLAAVIDVTDH